MMTFLFFPIRLWSEFPCKCKIYILPFVFLDLWILSEMAETWVVRGELETLRACKSKPSSQPASERANERRRKCTRLMWIRSDKSSVRRATNTHTFANFLGFYVCCTCINWARYSALAQSVVWTRRRWQTRAWNWMYACVYRVADGMWRSPCTKRKISSF